MNINDIHDFWNFIINKSQGGWYAPEEIDNTLDFGQMSLYNDYYLEFGKSQRLNDGLAPFKSTFQFTNATTPSGLVASPADYVHLMSMYAIIFDPVRGTLQKPIPILNEDEIAARMMSQVIPLSTSDPFGVIVKNWNVQLYPQVPQAGNMFYLRRPLKPRLNYQVISGRVIHYLPGPPSQDLEWAEKDQLKIIVIALNFAGINLSEADIVQWTQNKTNMDLSTKNKL
jgi:hypothetical protein